MNSRLTLSLVLGVAWWAAFLVPEISRDILIDDGELPTILWGLLRVVGLVAGACVVFVRGQLRWPAWRWLMAVVCYWVGAALFVFTATGPAGIALYAPGYFALWAWYVVIPMTVATVLLLSRSSSAPRSA